LKNLNSNKRTTPLKRSAKIERETSVKTKNFSLKSLFTRSKNSSLQKNKIMKRVTAMTANWAQHLHRTKRRNAKRGKRISKIKFKNTKNTITRDFIKTLRPARTSITTLRKIVRTKASRSTKWEATILCILERS